MLELIKRYKTACMFILAVFLSLFGCGLLTAGFIVAPIGIIDSSVMISAGEVFTFAGSILGINATYRSRLEDKQ